MTKLCIIAGNHHEAKTWARGQMLDDSDWFYPTDESDLNNKSNFYVIVIGTAGVNVPNSYFNRILETAQRRGRIGR